MKIPPEIEINLLIIFESKKREENDIKRTQRKTDEQASAVHGFSFAGH